ncbi:MAG: hypothetical protein KDA99_00410 [Planctomycetales bacterium]|nr:hypothetical protein [Planctomycetales bacterium]
MSWAKLLDDAALANVLPQGHQNLAAPIRAALAFFLDRLPQTQQRAILDEQSGLPPLTPISMRLGRLARQSPVLHKLGQVLARDTRLPLEFRLQLQQLEALPPSLPWRTIREQLQCELGCLELQGIELEYPALAEASVAVVVPFRRTGPTQQADADRDRGVFKVLKPHIRETLLYELELLQQVGVFLDESCESLRIPVLDYGDTFRQVSECLAAEVRLDLEQQHLREADACYGDDPAVLIPRLLEPCSPRVTAMERVEGVKITESHVFRQSGIAVPSATRLARTVARTLIARPFLARSGHALFHADPHAGNIMLTRDGRVALLDWSLAGRLSESARRLMVQLALSAAVTDAVGIESALLGLSISADVDRQGLKSTVHQFLQRIVRGEYPGSRWLTDLMDKSYELGKLRFEPDLMMFRETLLTLEGLLCSMAGNAAVLDKEMVREFVWQFLAEWPVRWIMPPDHRFGTRISNFDLIHWAQRIPSTVAYRGVTAWMQMSEIVASPLPIFRSV